MEQFSIETKNKTKIKYNFSGQLQQLQTLQWANQNSKQRHVTGAKRGKNACEQVTIGFGFASHWLRKWREFC